MTTRLVYRQHLTDGTTKAVYLAHRSSSVLRRLAAGTEHVLAVRVLNGYVIENSFRPGEHVELIVTSSFDSHALLEALDAYYALRARE